MMIRLLLAFSCVYFFGAGAFANEMDGEWVSISRIRGGVQQFGDPTQAVIKDGKFSTVREGEYTEIGNISEDAQTLPKHYTVEMTSSAADEGKKFNGIYAASADTLITCANPVADGKHPEGFGSTKENGYILVVWMRKSAIEKDRNEADRDKVTKRTASLQIGNLATACKLYKLDVGALPSSLQDLLVLPAGMNQKQWQGPYLDGQAIPRDPWGQPFVLVNNPGERVSIRSSGPDLQAGTPDDISENIDL